MGTSALSAERILSIFFPMERLRNPGAQVGLAMGFILLVVGVTLGNYGIVGFGVVIALAGFFSGK
jgi:hypothetical protein